MPTLSHSRGTGIHSLPMPPMRIAYSMRYACQGRGVEVALGSGVTVAVGVLVGFGVGVAVGVGAAVSVRVAVGTSVGSGAVAVGAGATAPSVGVARGPGAGMAHPASSAPTVMTAAMVFFTSEQPPEDHPHGQTSSLGSIAEADLACIVMPVNV